MTHNPYSPPGSAVADTTLPVRGPRPWQVTALVFLPESNAWFRSRRS